MTRFTDAFMVVSVLLAAAAITTVNCNAEGDALNAFKVGVADPNNVLQSWDPTLANPCTWFHVTCNSQNSVTRLDLGDAGLTGILVPQLGMLANLQYLELYGNNLSGSIPAQLGNLTALVSLDLYSNKFTGQIPSTLANLHSLRFLRLNNNKLQGKLPVGLVNLVYTGNLRIMDVSRNLLSGTTRSHNKTELAITTIIQDPKAPQS
ncbi:unnamed protein product [Linum tenue]|uniref:Leucine-rich repeat-containing N-terminal plant-type domain-containing protein n=1 Tax=Linum tenue TaxID=586396 RepID=A0AAV0NVC1_9ROSI|nr:unnamed protein product [Linum tenue]